MHRSSSNFSGGNIRAATSFGIAGAIIICRFVLLGYSNLACLLSPAASAFKVADGEKAESESKSVGGRVEVFQKRA